MVRLDYIEELDYLEYLESPDYLKHHCGASSIGIFHLIELPRSDIGVRFLRLRVRHAIGVRGAELIGEARGGEEIGSLAILKRDAAATAAQREGVSGEKLGESGGQGEADGIIRHRNGIDAIDRLILAHADRGLAPEAAFATTVVGSLPRGLIGGVGTESIDHAGFETDGRRGGAGRIALEKAAIGLANLQREVSIDGARDDFRHAGTAQTERKRATPTAKVVISVRLARGERQKRKEEGGENGLHGAAYL